ncbi:MAG TPA: S8 family serine peptidase [Bacillales bacterium]|nr:S8 family serine peptidase [Bacillales bacterium]
MKRSFVVVMALLMCFWFPGVSGAQSDGHSKKPAAAGKGPLPKITDVNGNKVFDLLESKLKQSGANEKLPVMIEFDSSFRGQAVHALERKLGYFSVKYNYSVVDGIAATLTKQQIEQLHKLPFVEAVQYDAKVVAFDASANKWFGATKARQDFTLNGDSDGNVDQYSKEDVVIAVIDTGIDDSHVDLDEGKVIGWKDFVNGKSEPYDDNGHGTHVSSIATGEGEGNAAYKGVAPGAALVGVKVLDSRGSGSLSDVTAGINWAVEHQDQYGIEILSLSLGTTGCSDGTDMTSDAVNQAVEAGLTVTVAAGNAGPQECTVGSPGAAAKVISVGAGSDLGQGGFFLAEFSSRGPTADGRIKPDIFAPGYKITAADANTGDGYVTYSGTSMATPFTAGVAALMLDANPSLTPSQLKQDIYSTAVDWGPKGKDIDYGYGRLDAYEAIEAAGGLNGTNIAVPDHVYKADSLPGSGSSDSYSFNVDNAKYPVAVTMIIPDWQNTFAIFTDPDFDVYLYGPSGNMVASSETTARQETISFNPSKTGTYRLEVSSYSGNGDYFFDLSAGVSDFSQTADNR